MFLYGKKASQFDEAAVDNLKQSLTSMAQEYCSVQDCPLNGTIRYAIIIEHHHLLY